jgi:hypothetical protein
VGKSGFIDKDAANGVGLIEGNYGGQKPAWTFFFFDKVWKYNYRGPNLAAQRKKRKLAKLI